MNNERHALALGVVVICNYSHQVVGELPVAGFNFSQYRIYRLFTKQGQLPHLPKVAGGDRAFFGVLNSWVPTLSDGISNLATDLISRHIGQIREGFVFLGRFVDLDSHVSFLSGGIGEASVGLESITC